ncbi:hypothetical protein [Nocardia gipuzkoensis]
MLPASPAPRAGPARSIARRGGGHAWPGGDTTTVPVALTGTVTTTLNANHIIWDFFRTPAPTPRSLTQPAGKRR